MDELEKLRAQAVVAEQRIAELQQQLAAAQHRLHEITDRLTLSPQEEAILRGSPDGCIRIGKLRPVLRRLLGRAA